jgi:predicted DNA-binding protein
MRKMMSLRLPDDLTEELEKVSNEIERDKTFIIVKALRKYFEEYAGYQVAIDRLKDKDDKIITMKEMENRFDD